LSSAGEFIGPGRYSTGAARGTPAELGAEDGYGNEPHDERRPHAPVDAPGALDRGDLQPRLGRAGGPLSHPPLHLARLGAAELPRALAVHWDDRGGVRRGVRDRRPGPGPPLADRAGRAVGENPRPARLPLDRPPGRTPLAGRLDDPHQRPPLVDP